MIIKCKIRRNMTFWYRFCRRWLWQQRP